MNAIYRNAGISPAEAVVREYRFYYLDAGTRRQLDAIIREYASRRTGDAIWQTLCDRLPVRRGEPESMRCRVEGLSYVAECLWDLALESGRKAFGETFSRENLHRAVRSLPIGYYHYMVGSRQPAGEVQTRRDALQDPGVALAKLEHDIQALGDFIRSLPGDGAN